MSLLAVERLGVDVAGRSLLRDVSFDVDAGDRVGLIGESGSGKSITSLAVLGLLPQGLVATGSTVLGGTQVVGARDRDLDRVRGREASVVFQEPLSALDPLMRLGRQVAWPLRRHAGLRGAALRNGVIEALAEVSLPDPERIAASYPHEVSGGQRQRVAIALALACRPRLLIADEPTTALDVTVQAEVLTLLDDLVAARGMAMLFISHDLPVVARMVERVVVLRGGDMVESGPVESVLARPRHPYTAELVESARTLDSALGAGQARGGAR